MVLPLKECDMVLGVQWLLALWDIVWNFSSLTMQFIVKGVSCTIHGIVLGSLAVDNSSSSSRCFTVVGQAFGPYILIMSTPKQVALSTMTMDGGVDSLQKLLEEFADVFQVPKGLPPP